MNEYPSRLTYGGFYIALLLVGLWFCVFRHPKNARAYTVTGTSLVMALLAWIARPVLTTFGDSVIYVERIPSHADFVETFVRSFINSLFSALPIGLMLSVVVTSVRNAGGRTALDGMKNQSKSRRHWFFPVAVAIVAVNILMSALTITFEYNWYRLVGAAPYLLLLTCGALYCQLHWRRIGVSGIFATAALLLALIASYVQPWLARQIHLLTHGRTSQYFEVTNSLGYEYESGYLLIRSHFFVSLICEAVPVLLLTWAVFRLPELSEQEPGTGIGSLVSEQKQPSDSVVASNRSRPSGSPLMFKKLFAMLGWSALMGIGSGVLFIAFMLGYMLFIEEPAPAGHGSLGITNGSLVLIVGIIPIFVVGLIIGIVIAAKRARRQ